jgi:methylated-DNA-[protein]-cysteine S-methyltransferase
MRTHTIVDSPLGPLTLVAENGALAGLYMTEQRHLPDMSRHGERDDDVLPEAREQLVGYWSGALREFDLPLHLIGTPFRRRVWQALQAIPYGETWSYGKLAAEIGQPTASRAVGLANGRNPVGVVVPCHRVVGSTGSLTGYGGGLARKQWLLEHERTHRQV